MVGQSKLGFPVAYDPISDTFIFFDGQHRWTVPHYIWAGQHLRPDDEIAAIHCFDPLVGYAVLQPPAIRWLESDRTTQADAPLTIWQWMARGVRRWREAIW